MAQMRGALLLGWCFARRSRTAAAAATYGRRRQPRQGSSEFWIHALLSSPCNSPAHQAEQLGPCELAAVAVEHRCLRLSHQGALHGLTKMHGILWDVEAPDWRLKNPDGPAGSANKGIRACKCICGSLIAINIALTYRQRAPASLATAPSGLLQRLLCSS